MNYIFTINLYHSIRFLKVEYHYLPTTTFLNNHKIFITSPIKKRLLSFLNNTISRKDFSASRMIVQRSNLFIFALAGDTGNTVVVVLDVCTFAINGVASEFCFRIWSYLFRILPLYFVFTWSIDTLHL